MSKKTFKQILKSNLKGYRKLTAKNEAFFESLGCKIVRKNKHPILLIPTISGSYKKHAIGSTVSDGRRGGLNLASEIYRLMTSVEEL